MTAEYPSATREIGMVILAIVALVVVYLMVTVTLAFGLFGAFVLVAFVYVWFSSGTPTRAICPAVRTVHPVGPESGPTRTSVSTAVNRCDAAERVGSPVSGPCVGRVTARHPRGRHGAFDRSTSLEQAGSLVRSSRRPGMDAILLAVIVGVPIAWHLGLTAFAYYDAGRVGLEPPWKWAAITFCIPLFGFSSTSSSEASCRTSRRPIRTGDTTSTFTLACGRRATAVARGRPRPVGETPHGEGRSDADR